MFFLKALSSALLFLQPCLANQVDEKFHQALQQRADREKALQEQQHLQKRQNISACDDPSCYQFYTSKTKPYFIESWPDVPFKTGEFYSGSVPIDESDPSRTLFFIFKPAEDAPVDEVTIWLNGGPGCSSLVGFFQENGPILWQSGTEHPMKNDFAWSKITNLLWVEQPVGTGFATGTVEAKNEVDVAKDFVKFFEKWQKLFGIKNYKIYMTGESYAGRYVPYIGAQMLDQKDTTYFDLKGALVYDPCIGDCNLVQGVFPTYYFALNNNDILNFDSSQLAAMEKISESCGFNAYLDTYLQFPPPGNQPTINERTGYNKSCNVLNTFYDVVEINPCFNIYHITDYCPILWDVLTSGTPYFDRADVKKALHAPANVTWTECSSKPVFIKDVDRSPNVNINGGVLPQVIEATNNVLVANADWDALLYTNGTLLAIQNMTWNGQLGFQSAPTEDFVVNIRDPKYGTGPQGVMGRQHYERGLQWVETFQAGHMQPQYQPRAAFLHLEWLLGRISKLPSSL